MNSILTQIVDRLADAVASLDAMEAELIANGVLKTDAVGSRFHSHKQTVEQHLSGLRAAIAQVK